MSEGKQPSRIRRRRVAGSERTLEARTALADGEAAATGTRKNIETEVKIIMKLHLRPVAALAAAALLAGGLLRASPATAAENPASSPSAQHPPRRPGLAAVGMTSSVDAQTTPQARTVAAAAATCSGARGYTGFWGWGWQTALDSCDTD